MVLGALTQLLNAGFIVGKLFYEQTIYCRLSFMMTVFSCEGWGVVRLVGMTLVLSGEVIIQCLMHTWMDALCIPSRLSAGMSFLWHVS